MDIPSEYGRRFREVVESGDNWTVTAVAKPTADLGAVIRSGFAQEVARKVEALGADCCLPLAHPDYDRCDYCAAVADVLAILETYR